jgi:hypothetical protein
MNKKAQTESKRRRAFAYKTRRRLKVSLLLGWKKRRRKSPAPRVETPRRGRSREDQITIEVLRYRVDHPEAVTGAEGEAVFSEAFKNFILQRCAAGAKNFNHRKFARAAGMPAATLRIWLQEHRDALAAARRAGVLESLPQEVATRLATARKRKRSFGETVRAVKAWVVEGLRPEPILPVGFNTYGGIELKLKSRRYTLVAYGFAVLVHFAALGTFLLMLEKGETPRSLTLMKYVELREYEVKEERKEPQRVSESGGGGEPGAAPAGASNVAMVSDNYVPMADVAVIQDEIAQLVQSGMPALPGRSTGAPFGNIVGSSNPLALPDLNFGANGYSSNSETDPSGLGLPQGFPGQGQGYTPGLASAKVGYGGGGGSGSGNYGGGGRAGGTGVNRTGTGSGGANVTRVTSEDLKKTRTNIDFNKLFRELTDWMGNNEVELPVVLKQYMRYNAGDITSRVMIEASPVSYDLFLLANPQSQDIGLLLVSRDEASNAVLLRDTGFRKKSFTLHEGTAGREDGTSNVLSLSMSEEDPTEEVTDKFYRIILAWWDNRSKGAQNP